MRKGRPQRRNINLNDSHILLVKLNYLNRLCLTLLCNRNTDRVILDIQWLCKFVEVHTNILYSCNFTILVFLFYST